MKNINEHKKVLVASLPICDIDQCQELAEYDCKIPVAGVWGNLCQNHFAQYHCELGLGKGQQLVLINKL